MCGEKGCCRFSSLNHSGSPPRVRGKGFLHFAHKMLEGITPAYAGKSTTAGRGRMPSRDHPRVCGEKGDKVKHCFHDLGSPPRMRGKDGINDSAQAVTGITPACAGKRVRHRRISKPTRDHPRVCGEKLKFGTNVTKNPGSPPRVRGKEAPGRLCSDGRGITPAYAGKSFPTGCNSSLAQDHPRVCGEKNSPTANAAGRAGSPPRVRGKAISGASPRRAVGITPACAGKSACTVL